MLFHGQMYAKKERIMEIQNIAAREAFKKERIKSFENLIT